MAAEADGSIVIAARREVRLDAPLERRRAGAGADPVAVMTRRSGRVDGEARDDRELIFFCPDVTDATTLKRVRQFQDQGYPVTVFGFRRERYNRDYAPSWPYVPLGGTTDGRYGQRLRALLGALPALVANRDRLRRASILYARNIDQLVLALLARPLARAQAPIAYEVLDIPPIMTGRGVRSRMLRAIERFCLDRIHLLILSSPGFHRSYYAAVQRYSGDWFLLENKLHPSIRQIRTLPISPDRAGRDGARRRWIVGYFGLIRGDATFDLITRLAGRLVDQVEFRFRGVLTTVGEARFHAALRQHPNITYAGPYVPHQDLAVLYRDVDFAWALDLEHVDHNSRWLMPCRFYEAGYFGVPCLAVRGFELGDRLEQRQIGWTFGDDLEESLVEFFRTLDPVDYDRTRRRLMAEPEHVFVAGDDVAALCGALDGARTIGTGSGKSGFDGGEGRISGRAIVDGLGPMPRR